MTDIAAKPVRMDEGEVQHAEPKEKPIPFVSFREMRRREETTEDWLDFLRQTLDEKGDIFEFGLVVRRLIAIGEADLVRQVLVTKANKFVKDDRDVTILSRFIGRGLVTTNSTEHKEQRKLAQPAFHARRIRSYADVMVNYAAQMVAGWKDGETRDISSEMMELTMYIATKTLFDVDRNEMSKTAQRIGRAIHELQRITDEDFNRIFALPTWLPTQHNRQRTAARRELDSAIEAILQERRHNLADGTVTDAGDLLSMMMAARDETGNPLGETELRDQMVTLFVAGHETTSNALTWTWYLLSQHPEVEAQMHREIDMVMAGRTPTLDDLEKLPYTLMVLKESMRMLPPVPAINVRKAVEETTLGDYTIPKGSRVIVSPWVMHYDKRYFPNPERFDPQRFAPEREAEIDRYAYLPFGGGPRVCIGNAFATMEAHLILATVAQRYQFRLAPGTKVKRQPQVTMSPAGGLPMQLTRRT